MKKRLTQVLSVLAMTCILAGSIPKCTATVHAEGTSLRIGVRGDIMNFSYLNEANGKFYGMEIDLAQALADELGYTSIEYVQVQPNDRKEKLLNGEVDCLIAAYSIADTRKENFDFSAAYYTDDTKIMVEQSALFKEVQDLKGLTIGTMAGTNAAPMLAIKLNEIGMIGEETISNENGVAVFDGITIKQMNSYPELSAALEEGAIDAVCMDGVIANAYMDEDRAFLPLDIGEQSYGVATQKDSELSSKMAEAVDKLLEDGTVAKLIDKWD